MKRLLAPGPVAGILTAAAAIATAYGHDGIAAALSNPNAPAEILAAISTIGGVVAGLLHNGSKPPAPLV